MANIIYIVDKKNSALHIAATTRVYFSGGKILIANEYRSTLQLLKRINEEKDGIILFCWRKALADIISLKRSIDLYKEIERKFTLVFLIPDHMGLEKNFGSTEAKMINACDYYVVTSQILFNEYCAKYPSKPPKMIFHDLPNVQLISEVRNKFPKKNYNKIRIIWVGNSMWGQRQGYNDHKGYVSVISQLKSDIAKHGDCCDLVVIDSATNYLPQYQVLKCIRDSDILLQTSRNEGTGLPIIEALGLGTEVISNRVGVANEILYESQILDNFDIEKLHENIHASSNLGNQENLIEQYDSYISNSVKESLVFFDSIKSLPTDYFIKQKIIIKLYWIYRYMLNLKSITLRKVT
jgi:glycosyltransferase involved in cell wall biosynthesis